MTLLHCLILAQWEIYFDTSALKNTNFKILKKTLIPIDQKGLNLPRMLTLRSLDNLTHEERLKANERKYNKSAFCRLKVNLKVFSCVLRTIEEVQKYASIIASSKHLKFHNFPCNMLWSFYQFQIVFTDLQF